MPLRGVHRMCPFLSVLSGSLSSPWVPCRNGSLEGTRMSSGQTLLERSPRVNEQAMMEDF